MRAFAIVAACLVWWPAAARAETLTLLCSNGLRAVVQDVVPEFERATGHQVRATFSVSAELKKRIDAGERFDLAVLTPALVDDLVARGTIVGATRRPIARSGMALAIRSGSPKPDLRSVDALQRALRAVPSIAFAREGAGGQFFNALVARFGLASELAPKFRPVVTGEDVSRAVAAGDAALGVLPLSEILAARGIEVAGMFPRDVQDYAVMVGGVSASATSRAAAQALLDRLLSPATDPVVQRRGMERVP
jgi:molybdate transport system substrate-binding protein